MQFVSHYLFDIIHCPTWKTLNFPARIFPTSTRMRLSRSNFTDHAQIHEPHFSPRTRTNRLPRQERLPGKSTCLQQSAERLVLQPTTEPLPSPVRQLSLLDRPLAASQAIPRALFQPRLLSHTLGLPIPSLQPMQLLRRIPRTQNWQIIFK